MKKLFFIAILVLFLYPIFSCVSISNTSKGEDLLNKMDSKGDKVEILSWAKNGLGSLSIKYSKIFLGEPNISKENKSLIALGWYFSENISKSLDLAFYKHKYSHSSDYMLALLFRRNGNLVDFQIESSNIPTTINYWSSEVVIQVFAYNYTINRLDYMLSNVLDRSLNNLKDDVNEEAGNKIDNYINDSDRSDKINVEDDIIDIID